MVLFHPEGEGACASKWIVAAQFSVLSRLLSNSEMLGLVFDFERIEKSYDNDRARYQARVSFFLAPNALSAYWLLVWCSQMNMLANLQIMWCYV